MVIFLIILSIALIMLVQFLMNKFKFLRPIVYIIIAIAVLFFARYIILAILDGIPKETYKLLN